MEIGKIIINITVINDYDPRYLHVGDLSEWKGAKNLPATICIIPPGSKKSINTTFQKHRINSFNSTNLMLSCVKECEEQDYIDLPDGIWTLVLKSGYEGIEKTLYYLKTDRFTLELDKIYVRAGMDFDKEKKQFREDLQDLHFLINSAHSQIRVGDHAKANRDFTEAQVLLKKYIDCKDCL
jgi:hypothetical protein